jgi:tRNA U38,U39,U40 pseudouridine synthase TruA
MKLHKTKIRLVKDFPAHFIVYIPEGQKDSAMFLYDKLTSKYNSVANVEITVPYKKRTTGKYSQNRHINGHVQQIIEYTGDDYNNYKYQAKLRAIKRGYPYTLNKFGQPVPFSETKINTIQAGYLIDQLHEDAAFLGIILKEGY